MFTRILGMVVIALSASAQLIDPIWTQTIEDEDGSEFRSGCAVGDSAFVLYGYEMLNEFYSPDSTVLCMVTKAGETLWRKAFEPYAFSGHPLIHNGEIWIRGSLFSVSSQIIRLSLAGDTLGTATWGEYQYIQRAFLTTGLNDQPIMVRQLADSNFENHRTDISFLDEQGFPLMTVNIDWDSAHYVHDFITVSDGYVLLGSQANEVEPLFWMKIGFSGEVLWYRTLFVPGQNKFLVNILPLDDGGFLTVGSASITGHGDQGWLVKLSSVGDTVWTKNYGGPGADQLHSIIPTDSGYTLVGYYNQDFPGDYYWDTWMLFVDENGDSLNQFVDTLTESESVLNVIAVDSTILLIGGRHNPFSNRYIADATLWGKTPVIEAQSFLGFRETIVGESRVESLTVYNRGSNVLRIDSIADASLFDAVFEGPHFVEVGETYSIPITFSPVQTGAFVDTIVILSNTLPHPIRCIGFATLTSTDSVAIVPKSFAVHPPYPNPFNASTSIEFELPRSADVTLKVYDVQGRLVTTLLDVVAAAGVHSVSWGCAECASGLYFVRMEAGEFVATQKLLLVK